MTPKKQYGSADGYELKLKRVMERLGAQDYNWNYDRFGCYVEFRYRDELYRFEHSIEKATAKGITLRYGSDAFAQVVLALEDLARMVERGIYDLSTWVAGMRFLPPPPVVPECFMALGFEQIPSGAEDVKERYRQLAKLHHPDAGGSDEAFHRINAACELAIRYFGKE